MRLHRRTAEAMPGFSFLHLVALVVTLLAPQRVSASATSAILCPNCYTHTIPNPGVCAFRGGGEDSSSGGSRQAAPSPLRSSTWAGGVGHKMGGGGYGRRRIPGVGVPKGVLERGLHGIHYVVSKTSRLALVFPLLVASDAVRVPVDALPAAACTLAGASVPLNTMKLLFGRGSFLGKWTYIVTHKLLLPARLVWASSLPVTHAPCACASCACLDVAFDAHRCLDSSARHARACMFMYLHLD